MKSTGIVESYSILVICDDVHPNPGPENTNYSVREQQPSDNKARVNNLRVISFNAQSLKSHSVEHGMNKLCLFQNLIYSGNNDIASVTETWLTDNISDGEILGNGYTIYRRDRVDGRKGGGVLTAIRHSLASTRRRDLEQDIEMLVVIEIFQANCPSIILATFYRPPNFEVSFVVKFNTFLQMA